MKKTALWMTLACLALPALVQAGRYDKAIADCRELETRVKAISIVGTPQSLDVNRVKGDLEVLPPFVDRLASSLAGVNIGPAQELRSASLDLKVKVTNMQGQSNYLVLGAEIVNHIGPALARCRLLLPQVIAQLEQANNPAVQQLKDLIRPTVTPIPPTGPVATPRPDVTLPTPVYRPTPPDQQPGVPGPGSPPVAPPPPPGNPGLIPPPFVERPTPTPQPWQPPTQATPAPTAHPTPVGQLKAPAAMLLPNHQRWVYVALVNAGQVAVLDTRLRRVIETIPAGNRPVALASNDSGQRLLIVNHGSGSVTVADGNSHSVLGTVAVGSGPVDAVLTPNGKKAYVANQGSHSVSVILMDGLRVLKTIPVGVSPSRLVMEANGRTVYVSNTQSDTVSVIDTSVDEVVAQVAQ